MEDEPRPGDLHTPDHGWPAGERAGAVTFDLGDAGAGTATASGPPRLDPPKGAKPRKGRARSAPAPTLVKPAAWRPGGRRPPPADPRQLCSERDLDRVATDAMLAKLADGTRATYRGGWRSWLLWRQLRGDSPYLQGETRDERLADEDDLIRYVVHLYNTNYGPPIVYHQAAALRG